jgi:hypothetical protein
MHLIDKACQTTAKEVDRLNVRLGATFFFLPGFW